MSELPGDLLYTNDHEWVRREGDGSVKVGFTDHSSSALVDLVYVDLPDVGQDVDACGVMGVVVSVKAAWVVYGPVGGSVNEINVARADDPEKINADPYGEGWIVKMQVPELDESDLMSPDAYQKLLDELDD